MKISNTICGAAWGSVSTDTMGRLRPCCTINSTTLTDSKGEPYKIDKVGDLERFWYSNTLKEIRQAGIEGKWHKLCFRCKELEEGGSFSQRMIYENLLPKTVNSVPNIKMINLFLSNKCNMKCRMCSPKNSHLLGRESKKHGLSDLWKNDVWGSDQTSTYSEPISINDEALIELIESYHDTLNEIQFVGGEPFLSNTQHLILKKFIDLGVSDKITITYNTNGTIPMDEYFDMWSKFKKISISVSLDATEDLANYIRYPTDWNNIQKVMSSLDKVCTNIINVKVNCLVQALNVLRLDKLVDWMDQFDNICKIPSFTTLVLPRQQHLRNIPQELRIQAAKKLEKQISDLMVSQKDNVQLSMTDLWTLGGAIERMKKVVHNIATEPDANDNSEFFKFNRTLDKVRNTDLFTILPELIPYVNSTS